MDRASATAKRVLIATIAPVSGGVPTMTRFVVEVLREQGLEPVLAHYEPYSVSPALSVPSYRLWPGRRPGAEQRLALAGCETHALGAWLPELEFTHYRATQHWRSLIHSCHAHLVVAGNILPATPYWQSATPYLAWVATGWEEDRVDRVARFAWPRRALDRWVNSRILRRLERRLLRAGSILPLSHYTQKRLNTIAGQPVANEVLSMPVDSHFFTPQPEAVVPGRIGFSGRIDDPRKNVELLLHAMARLVAQGHDLTARLIGGKPNAQQQALVSALGLARRVEFLPYLSQENLRQELRQFDLFVLPSHQEGLCIAALEAMACGAPVVATRCGGPEEFVIDHKSGFLTAFDPTSMAASIAAVLTSRESRNRLSAGAVEIVTTRYTRERSAALFWNTFRTTFLHNPG